MTARPAPTDWPSSRRLLARLGVALSAFAVFTCGWLATQTDDWRRMLLYSVLALGAGALASGFSRRAR